MTCPQVHQETLQVVPPSSCGFRWDCWRWVLGQCNHGTESPAKRGCEAPYLGLTQAPSALWLKSPAQPLPQLPTWATLQMHLCLVPALLSPNWPWWLLLLPSSQMQLATANSSEGCLGFQMTLITLSGSALLSWFEHSGTVSMMVRALPCQPGATLSSQLPSISGGAHSFRFRMGSISLMEVCKCGPRKSTIARELMHN